MPMYSWPGVKSLLKGRPPWIWAGGPCAHDLQVGGADGDAIDAHEDLGALRHGNGLLDQRQLVRVTQDPGLHGVRDRKRRVHLHVVRLRHAALSSDWVCCEMRRARGSDEPGCARAALLLAPLS